MNLIPANMEELPKIYEAMERNFIKEELREYDDVVRVCNGEKYTVYHAEEDGIKKGFVGVWDLTDFVFLEYFVVYEPFRNGGVGGRVIDLLEQKFGRVILETELPEQPIQIRRFNFYKRHGMQVNLQPYRQPPYREGDSGCPLYLMSYPSVLTDFDMTVKLIYKVVYNREYIPN
ncbi:MAG: GNAT family N-acetyltransferase [Candidatus Coproplasma sp.]